MYNNNLFNKRIIFNNRSEIKEKVGDVKSVIGPIFIQAAALQFTKVLLITRLQ